MFTDTSHYAYSGVITQAVKSSKDLRSISYTSGSFINMQQLWSATKREVFAVYQSVLKFDLYLRGVKCVFCHNYKPLEPFLSKDIKILKHNGLSIELADYNITFVYIKGKDNVLTDAITRLKPLNINKEPSETTKVPVASNAQENVMETHATDMHTISITMLHTEQKWDIMCRKLALQLCHGKIETLSQS